MLAKIVDMRAGCVCCSNDKLRANLGGEIDSDCAVCAVSESVCQSVAWNSAHVIWSSLPLSCTSDMSKLFTGVVCDLRQTDLRLVKGKV
jgi:hypothetical protein